MSIIQLLEIFYDRIYIVGIDETQSIVDSILAGPIDIINTISYQVICYQRRRVKTRRECREFLHTLA